MNSNRYTSFLDDAQVNSGSHGQRSDLLLMDPALNSQGITNTSEPKLAA